MFATHNTCLSHKLFSLYNNNCIFIVLFTSSFFSYIVHFSFSLYVLIIRLPADELLCCKLLVFVLFYIFLLNIAFLVSLTATEKILQSCQTFEIEFFTGNTWSFPRLKIVFLKMVFACHQQKLSKENLWIFKLNISFKCCQGTRKGFSQNKSFRSIFYWKDFSASCDFLLTLYSYLILVGLRLLFRNFPDILWGGVTLGFPSKSHFRILYDSVFLYFVQNPGFKKIG